jgi:micrococcal nuclease
MFGIDTPESRTRNKEEKIRGLLAKKYLTEALKKGKNLSIKTYKDYETGKFGRILGDVWIDGKSINAQMIKEFMAVPYRGQSKEAIEKLHEANKLMLQRLGKISG